MLDILHKKEILQYVFYRYASYIHLVCYKRTGLPNNDAGTNENGISRVFTNNLTQVTESETEIRVIDVTIPKHSGDAYIYI